ncbi:MAG TPA: S-methyl-5'-thioadenosine phosphorylase [Dermatophilaceae bacterium]|nr:S-methyl-5'-thioadenosine phosphorylase [Dermatophilaceae bacterium]
MSSAPTPGRVDPTDHIDIGVIGGSGLYAFLPNFAEVRLTTPFGDPSDAVHIGEVAGRQVAFLSRHGRGHRYPAHLVNYRANVWALRSLGVRQVVAAGAVGSLRPEHGAGTIVVPDQIIDRTWGREHTVYGDLGATVHVGLADPFCPSGRTAALRAAGDQGHLPVVDGGTILVINGPRFSTRAEAAWHRQAGASVVGMTSMPEAAIARELALCYTSLCLVTDLDAGVGPDDAVTHAGFMEVFRENIGAFAALVGQVVAQLPEPEQDQAAGCACRHSVDGLSLPFALP